MKMPRSDDGEDEVKDNRSSDVALSRNYNSKESEMRRNLRWISFARPRVVFGFDHLSPAYIPSMTRKNSGFCLCIDKITGWRPPLELLNDTVKRDDICVSVKLNISLYHLNSISFFGSTWSSEPVVLNDDGSRLPDELTVDFGEVVYLLSRVNDPSCIGVVEIVAMKENIDTGVCLAQYGCGWVQVPLFNLQPPPPDIAEGYENVKDKVSPPPFPSFHL